MDEDQRYAFRSTREITPDYALAFLAESADQRARSLVLPADRRAATERQVTACRECLAVELAQLRAIRDRAQMATLSPSQAERTLALHIVNGS